MPKRIIALTCLLVAVQSACQRDTSDQRVSATTGNSESNGLLPSMGRIMVSAFKCATYAELSKEFYRGLRTRRPRGC